MKYFILSTFLVFLSLEVKAKNIEVEVLGVGKDYDWAIMNALDNAVKQTNEVEIRHQSPMQKMEVKAKLDGKETVPFTGNKTAKYSGDFSIEEKEINAQYEGKVTTYNVISSEKKEDGLFYVKIKASINKTDDYISPNLIKKAKYTLSIVPFKANKQISCIGQKVSSTSLVEKISSVLSERFFKSKKFSIVDRENLDAYASELSLVVNGLAKEDQNRLKNIASADYILVGKIEYFNTNTTTQNITMTGESYSNSSASIQISYKLLETATMEVVAASSVDEKLKKDGKFSSCNNVEKELAQRAGNKIVNDILQNLFPNDYKKIEVSQEKDDKKVSKTIKQHKTQPIKLPFD